MTRPFRLEEDERRYFALRSEFFIRLVRSGVPTQTVHDVMRNFGKLEDYAFYEGVRQGMAAAALAPVLRPDDWSKFGAVETHSALYGAAATPLHRVERETVLSTGQEGGLDHPWLSPEPMEFGPLTIEEAIAKYGPDVVVSNKQTARGVTPSPTLSERIVQEIEDEVIVPATFPKAEEDDAGFDVDAALEQLANGADPEEVLGKFSRRDPGPDLGRAVLQEPIEIAPDEPVNKPALLDKIRDVLLRLDEPPKTWKDMILMLMREVRVDASHLDDMMSTPMGMTVISQANLFHLHPGAMPDIKQIPRPT